MIRTKFFLGTKHFAFASLKSETKLSINAAANLASGKIRIVGSKPMQSACSETASNNNSNNIIIIILIIIIGAFAGC